MLFIISILLLATTAVNSQLPVGRDYRGRGPPYYDETPKPYSFSYNTYLQDGYGQISRRESGDANGRVQGSYSLVNDIGHTRIVNYIADENGFRAHVRTNEPGTDNESPADVVFESSSRYANRHIYPFPYWSASPQAGQGQPGNRQAFNAPESGNIAPLPGSQPQGGRMAGPNSASFGAPPSGSFNAPPSASFSAPPSGSFNAPPSASFSAPPSDPFGRGSPLS